MLGITPNFWPANLAANLPTFRLSSLSFIEWEQGVFCEAYWQTFYCLVRARPGAGRTTKKGNSEGSRCHVWDNLDMDMDMDRSASTAKRFFSACRRPGSSPGPHERRTTAPPQPHNLDSPSSSPSTSLSLFVSLSLSLLLLLLLLLSPCSAPSLDHDHDHDHDHLRCPPLLCNPEILSDLNHRSRR